MPVGGPGHVCSREAIEAIVREDFLDSLKRNFFLELSLF